MKKIAKFGVAALVLAVFIGSAFAFGGFGNQTAREALEKGDYQGWKEAITAGLTEERFDQMHQRFTERQQEREEMEAAMDEGYESWKAFMEEHPRNHMIDLITEENFDTYVAMYQAKKDGDFEKAKELAQELGLENHCMGKFGGVAQ
jgi:hypothetical protein